MTNEDVNKFRGIVKEEIGPFGKKLASMGEKLNAVWEQTVRLTEDMTEVKEVLEEHTDKINALTLEVHDIHKEMGASQDKTTLELDKIKEHVGLPTSINS